jgi:hypothetical protein
LQKAIEAQGGLDRFDGTSEVVWKLRSGGTAFLLRRGTRRLPPFEVRFSTRTPHAVVTPYPEPGKRGVFAGDRVSIESESGERVAERHDPRAAFRNVRRKLWWDELDLLYFAGYALWNYVTAPFLFTRPGFELEERERWSQDGERWRRLTVRFPPGVPTHSPEQDFYFDERGLLRRHDYTAEVFGGWAKAAHYSFDHETFDGLVVPTRRRVFPRKRNNGSRPWPTLVWLDIEGVRRIPAQ